MRRSDLDIDSHPILSVYSQMWEMSARQPDVPLSFVYTDKQPQNINVVLEYFSKHSELIPPGMSLSVRLQNWTSAKGFSDLPGGFKLQNETYTWGPITSTAENPKVDYMAVLKATEEARVSDKTVAIGDVLLAQHRAPMQKMAVDAIFHILQSKTYESKKSSGVNELYSCIFTNANKMSNAEILLELKQIAETKNRSPREALASISEEGVKAAGKQFMRGVKVWAGNKTGKVVVDEDSKALYDLLSKMDPNNPKEFMGREIEIGGRWIKLPKEKSGKTLLATTSRFHQPQPGLIMNKDWNELIKFLSKAELNMNVMIKSVDPVVISQGQAWNKLKVICDIVKKGINNMKDQDVALFIIECRKVRDHMKGDIKASPYSELVGRFNNIFSSDFIKDVIFSKVDPTSSQVVNKFREEANACVERRQSFKSKI